MTYRLVVSALAIASLSLASALGQSLLPIGEEDLDPALLQPLYVTVTAVDKATGQPLEGVEATLKSYVDRSRYQNDEKTDADGKCRLDLPKSGTMSSVSVEGRIKGYVPIYMRWDDNNRKLEAPEKVRMEFEPSVTIGGVVQDVEGAPIEGVAVEVYIPATRSDHGNSFVFHITDTRTDAEGRWTSTTAPEDFSHLNVSFEHNDYQKGYIHGSGERGVLLKQAHSKVLTQGGVIQGFVFDEQGEPIEGARLLHGHDRFGSDLPRATTNERGEFKLVNCSPGVQPVTVQADGYSPDLREVSVPGSSSGVTGGVFLAADSPTTPQRREPPASTSEPIEFRLKPAAKLRVRLVDPNGAPIRGAFFASDTWRTHRSLDWRVDSDEEGRIAWDNAPHDEVQYDMGKRDYVSVRNRVIPADGEEHTIVMQPIVEVHGTVVDDATGEPIPEFRVVIGYRYRESSRMYWRQERGGSNDFRLGEFNLRFDEPQYETQLLIEAEGYKPYPTEAFRIADGEKTFEVRLVKGEPLVGSVVGPDGAAAGECQVVMLTKGSQSAGLEGTRFSQSWNAPLVEADKNGGFTFPEQLEPFLLVAVSEQGIGGLWTDRLGGQLPAIKLRPWGRVTGRAMIGAKPAAGVKVSLNNRDQQRRPLWVRGVGVVQVDSVSPEQGGNKLLRVAEAASPLVAALTNKQRQQQSPAALWIRQTGASVWHNRDTTTDADGRFTFPQALPGEVTATRMLYVSRGNGGTSYPAITATGQLEAGGALELTIGGTGRPVVGQLQKPANAPEGFLWAMAGDVKIHREGTNSWYSSLVENDGSFRFEDVSPGEYRLTVDVRESTSLMNRWNAPLIGSLSKTFTADPPAGGAEQSDEPIDLGEMQLEPANPPQQTKPETP